MPDQDEFAPLARRWSPVHEMILLGKSPQETADAAFRALREMLRECGGCPLLRELVPYLEEFSAAVSLRPAVGWIVDGEAERELTSRLDRRARDLNNRRIDAVAVRSCRIAAIEIAFGRFSRGVGPAFATLVAKHLLCHFALDRARTMALGTQTEQHARRVHAQVLEILAPHLERFGNRWIREPEAQFSMRLRLEPQLGTAAILAREEDFSLD
jgi:hypothetical protein